MEIFLDTADILEVRRVLPWGVIGGVTTNQKLFLQAGPCDFKERIIELASIVNGPVSVELTSFEYEDMIREATEYASWHSKVVVKVPMMGDGTGLMATRELSRRGIKINTTTIMSTNQVILASLAGTTYASIFFNRVKDAGEDPVRVIRESRNIIDTGHLSARIIVGSIRRPEDVVEAAVAGAHILTIPYKILLQMPYHSKSEETIKEFDKAWQEFHANNKIAGKIQGS